ncbi:MAG: hypothetical protein WDO56_32060 [Gammaproteobacteria bacterium]
MAKVKKRPKRKRAAGKARASNVRAKLGGGARGKRTDRARLKTAGSTGPRLRKVTLQALTQPGAMYQRVCKIARKLPGVEESTSYGTPALKVKGRFMARLRTEAEGGTRHPLRFGGPGDPHPG